ncbi:MAG: glycoside hydrolase family 9 protein [Oscillospiraceae bacterium]|nr:glycoside hydrolase family 9 protein [Oscillospiraceae bacterium]
MKKLTSALLTFAIFTSLAPLLEAPAAASTTPAVSEFIVVDQFGYRPDSQKVAVIRNPKRGIDANLSFSPGSVYQVINESNQSSVFQGSPVHKFADDVNSGDEIWWFDFSSVTAQGRYYLLDVDRGVRSPSFNIAEDVYNEVLKHAVRMFFYQRAGFEKQARFAGAGWADSASHLNAGQDRQARFFHEPDNAALERDLHGGWYDAGDFNKYTPWTARYVEDMLNIYRENPEVFGDDYNIPESRNGIPDIIDEAKWGMDYLLRLQNSDGSMISVVGLAGGSPPSAATGRTYYGRVNTTSAYAAARAFALGSVVFAQWDKPYANTLRAAAEKAWAWAEANPNVLYQNNSAEYNSQGLAAGGQEIGDDSTGARTENRLYAALYMFEMTKDKAYLTIFEENYRKFPLYQWWGFMDHYRTSQHLLYFMYMNLPEANPAVVADIKNGERGGLIAAFNKPDDFAGKLGECGYRAFLKDYPWGSNRAKSEMGLTFYLWNEYNMEPQKSTDFTAAAESYLHYIHGVNPFGMVYLTNMNAYGATKSLTSIYHDWFQSGSPKWDIAGVSTYGPAPGFLSGGANQGYNVQSGFPTSLGGYTPTAAEMTLGTYIRESLVGSPPMKMYMDISHGWPINSWEITEPSNGYQLAYIRLLSKFATLVIDTNDSGFTTADALNVLRYAAGVTELSAEQKTLYDFSEKGSVTTADALHILRLVAGI